MKINFLTPHLEISGGLRIALNYARLLSERGHEVRVIFQNKNYRKRIKNILELKPGAFFELFDNTPYWHRDLAAKVLFIPEINDKTFPDADVSMAVNFDKAGIINNLNENKGEKFQFIMHDERLYHGDKEKVASIYEQNINKICISSWLQEIIKKDFNQDSDLLITPVDTDLFYPDKSEQPEKDRLKIAMLHHNYKWKGVEDGLNVFRRVQQETGKNLELILFGSRFKNIEVDCDKYYYDPPQENLRKIYSESDIFLCPSEWEGLGMPAMEAMACKTAAVTYDTGGSRDYAFDGKTAFVAWHADPENLKNKLKQAVLNDSEREKIAENGFKFVTQELDSWEESVKKLEKILKSK